MKTSTLLRMSLPVIGAIFLFSCGGDKRRTEIQGIQDFVLSEFNILSPNNGENSVCLSPQIQIVVEKRTGLCNSPERVSDFLRIRQQRDPDEITELVPGFITVDSSSQVSNSECVIETFPEEVLLPETDYILEKAQKQSGSVTFDSANAVLFETGTFEDNRTCSGNLSLVENGEDWQETELLNIGEFDADGDVNLDFQDLGNLLIESVFQGSFQQIIGFGLPKDYSFEIEFNSKIQDFGLSAQVRVFKVNGLIEQVGNGFQVLQGDEVGPENFQLFNDSQLVGCASGNGRCIYLSPNSARKIRVNNPPTLWESGIYIVIVQETLRSQNGRFLDATYYNIFTIN